MSSGAFRGVFEVLEGFWGKAAKPAQAVESMQVASADAVSEVGLSASVVSEVMALKSATGLLVPAEVNGEACLVGTVQFTQPCKLRHLLNPFVQVRDAEGNQFRVRGFLGHVIAVESAKRRQPAGVVCVRRGVKEFEVVKWF